MSGTLHISPATETTSRRERRSNETRERIFQAALRLFSERGFHNVTVEQITEAADVGKGTFFNYFPSKEHLFMAFGEMQHAKIRTAVESAQSEKHMKPLLLQLALNLATGHARTPLLMSSLLSTVMSDPDNMKMLCEGLKFGRENVAKIFARGQLLSEVRSDVPPLELARVFQKLIFGTQVIWSIDPALPIEQHIEQSFNIFWSGVAAASSKAKQVQE
jgi:AcrR family transcriptional regulator